MESAMFLASIFGPLLAIVGLWMLVSGDNVVKVYTAIKNSPAALYALGVYSLLFGLFIITMFNQWHVNIFFFITLLGWVLFLRGILVLFVPHLVIKAMMSKTSWMKVQGIIPFIWGLILLYIAFYM